MSLVNVSLKFQTLISEICQYFFCWKNVSSFCSAKASLIFFSTKKIRVFGYKVVKHLTSWPLNELIKLTMLWKTGPWLRHPLLRCGLCNTMVFEVHLQQLLQFLYQFLFQLLAECNRCSKSSRKTLRNWLKSKISSKTSRGKRDSTKRHHHRHHQRQPGEQQFPMQVVTG